MSTPGLRCSDKERLMKWPLEYVNETKQYLCGWCGHVFAANHTHKKLETHFKSCKTSEETGQLVDKIKTEVMEETEVGIKMETTRAEFNKEISDIKKDLKTKIKSGETSLLNEFKAFEERTNKTLREMSAAQEIKMAEMNGRVSGVTEAISTVVHSMIEDRLKKENEALWVQLRKSEGDIQSARTEVAQLKTGTETLPKQMKTNNGGDLQVLKRQMETSKHLVKKKKNFHHVEPSVMFQQLTIPMNCFNLVTQNYLFQPSYKWTIDGIKDTAAQKTFELTSEMFQWNGYPVRTRAKLQLKENDCFYVKLGFDRNEVLESESTDVVLIPQVYYLLKNINLINPKHKCTDMGYLFTSKFTYSLDYEALFCHKSWFNLTDYKIDDSLEIEIYVEPLQMTQLVHSYDGTLEWNIENYTRKLQFEKKGLAFHQESPYFYTGPSGYRVQVKITLNKVKGLGPTACISFRTGKFDAQLPNSFPHSTTVTLVGRKNPEKNINKTIVEDITSKSYYSFEICKFEEMENVVENDTLFCKVLIKAITNN